MPHLEVTNSKFLVGNFLMLLACASSSFYDVYCKGLLRRFSPLKVLVNGYLLALGLSVPAMIWVEGISPRCVRNYGVNTWLALFILNILSWGWQWSYGCSF